MTKQFSVRYGRNYRVVLAIVLPSLLLLPFIFFMQGFKSLDEWVIWVIIYGFLGLIVFMTLWMIYRVYPPTLLVINTNEISLSFNRKGFLWTSDFSFNVSDIHSFSRREIGGNEYYVFETRNPYRKFQISPASNSLEDTVSFEEAMLEVSQLVNKYSGEK